MQQAYAEPIKPELIAARLHEIRDAGVTVAGSLSPQRTQQYYSTVLNAGVDLFVIRGTSVSAEHVSTDHEPLNLKKFIYTSPQGRARRACRACPSQSPCSGW